MVEGIVGLVEVGEHLRKVRSLEPNPCGEDMIFGVIEVVPHSRVDRFNAPGKAVPDECVSDLTAESYEIFLGNCARIPAECVVADQGTEAMGTDDVVGFGRNGFKH